MLLELCALTLARSVFRTLCPLGLTTCAHNCVGGLAAERSARAGLTLAGW